MNIKTNCLVLLAGCMMIGNRVNAQYPSLKSTQNIKVDGYKPYIYVNPFSMRPSRVSDNYSPNRSTTVSSVTGTGAKKPASAAPAFTERELEEIKQKGMAREAAKKILLTHAWKAMMDGDVTRVCKYVDSLAKVKNMYTVDHMEEALSFIASAEAPEKLNPDVNKHLTGYNLYIRPVDKSSFRTDMSFPVSVTDRRLHIRFDSTRHTQKYNYPEELHLLADLMLTRVMARSNFYKENGLQIMEEAIVWYDKKGVDWQRYDELRGINYYLCDRKTFGAKLMVSAMQKFPERKTAIMERLARELMLTGKDTVADEMYHKIRRGDIKAFDDNEPGYMTEFAFLTSFADAGQPEKGLEICREIEAAYLATGRSDTIFHKYFSPHFFEARLFLAVVANDDDLLRNFFSRKRAIAYHNLSASIESNIRMVDYARNATSEEYKDQPEKRNLLIKELDSTAKKARIIPYAEYLYELPVLSFMELKKCDLLKELLQPDLKVFESFHFQEMDYIAGYGGTPSAEVVALLERLAQCGIYFTFAD